MIVEVTTDDGGKTGQVRVAQRKGDGWGPTSFQKDLQLCPAGPYHHRLSGPGLRARDANSIENLMMEWPPAPILGGVLPDEEMECSNCEWL